MNNAFNRERTAPAVVEAGDEGSFRLLFTDHPFPMWVFDGETLRFLGRTARRAGAGVRRGLIRTAQ